MKLETLHRLCRLSVFTAAAFVVYLFSTIENVPYIGQSITFPVVAGGKRADMVLPALWIPITILHTVIAARLYVHAWAIDMIELIPVTTTTTALQNWREKLEPLGEWVLRGFWVALVSYLPTSFSKAANNVLIFNFSLEFYYVATFTSVCIWDFLMASKILKTNSPLAYINRGNNARDLRLKLLKLAWIYFDIVLLVSSVGLFVLKQDWVPLGQWENWKPPLLLLFLTISVGICLVQMIIWIPEIFHRTIYPKSTSKPGPKPKGK